MTDSQVPFSAGSIADGHRTYLEPVIIGPWAGCVRPGRKVRDSKHQWTATLRACSRGEWAATRFPDRQVFPASPACGDQAGPASGPQCR